MWLYSSEQEPVQSAACGGVLHEFDQISRLLWSVISVCGVLYNTHRYTQHAAQKIFI